MKQQLGQSSHFSDQFLETSEGFWANQWYLQWQKEMHPQALMHLCAYLQEPCYWAAEQITQRFVSVQYTLADGFQGAIARLEHILNRYDPNYGSNLKAYARTAFGNLIRNQLRQQKTANVCSDWALLRKLSQTQLHRALQTAGFVQTDNDILIWKCFKAICIPEGTQIASRTVRTLSQPTEQQLAAMAKRYNQQRIQLSPCPAAMTGEGVMKSLRRAVKAARSQLNPHVTSLNQPQYGDSRELMDDLIAAETPMAEMMAAEAYEEQQKKKQAIGRVLIDAIGQLDPSMQTLLRLYYQQNLTQKEIASQLQIKQYQVSRQLSRVRQQLLRSVAQWSQETLHISMDSSVLSNVSAVIHEWLQSHYAPKAVSTYELSQPNLSESTR
ncbi:MAG: sigma-70 family RNA polymerase sigma factor [Cyanobacteria bacterium J06576_12]